MSAWALRHFEGSAQALHDKVLPVPARRAAWLMVASERALTLGSAQAESSVNLALAERAGIAVVRRRSGGGAVLVGPGEVLWLDVIVPRGDPLWQDDIGRAMWWLGELWQDVLAGVGVDAEVWRGALRRDALSDAVCFGGLGAGELTVGGRKVVGTSQRRTRDQARLQSALLLRWPAALMADLSGLGPDLAAELARRAVGLDELVTVNEAALVEALDLALRARAAL